MSDSSMVIRNPNEMVKFANCIDEYCNRMKTECSKLLNSFSNSRPTMKDEISVKAISRSEELVGDLLKVLPPLEEVSDKLKASAKCLFEAQDII